MKERNDRKAWAAYEKEGKRLMEEAAEKRDAILKKYGGTPHPPGLDTDPSAKELGEVTEWYGEEVAKLRERLGIK